MTYFTQELQSIFIFVVASLVLSLVLFIAVYIMSFTSKVEFEKSSAYECGFAPFSETNFPFEVQFALIAIMFLLFDIEVLYLYPLSTSILDLTSQDMISVTIFFLILTVGIVFEVSRQVMSMNITSAVKNRRNIENIEENSLSSSIGFIMGFHEGNLILCLVLVLCFFLYFYKHRKSSVLLCPVAPFSPIDPNNLTTEELNLIVDAIRFIRNRLNENMHWVTICEEAYKLYDWDVELIDIGAVENIMADATWSSPAIPRALTNIVADTIETIMKTPVADTIVNTTADAVVNTAADTIIANAPSFQETLWFPIVVIGTVTILFLGLAELRNRIYPDVVITTDTTASDGNLYSIYEFDYTFSFPFITFLVATITVYILSYRLLNLNRSVFSYIHFTLFIIMVMIYVRSYQFVSNLDNPTSKEALSILWDYKYIIFTILGSLAIINKLLNISLNIKEEVVKILNRCYDTLLYNICYYLCNKISTSLKFSHIFFFCHFFLFFVIRAISLTLLINFVFFAGSVHAFAYTIPMLFFVWLLQFVDYYFILFRHEMINNLNEILLVRYIGKLENSSVDYYLLEYDIKDISFALSFLAEKEGFTTEDLDYLKSKWFAYAEVTRRYVIYTKIVKKLNIILLLLLLLLLLYGLYIRSVAIF